MDKKQKLPTPLIPEPVDPEDINPRRPPDKMPMIDPRSDYPGLQPGKPWGRVPVDPGKPVDPINPSTDDEVEAGP